MRSCGIRRSSGIARAADIRLVTGDARAAREAKALAHTSPQGQPDRPQQAKEPHDAAGVHERGANA